MVVGGQHGYLLASLLHIAQGCGRYFFIHDYSHEVVISKLFFVNKEPSPELGQSVFTKNVQLACGSDARRLRWKAPAGKPLDRGD
jgi:hypothetical protein